MGIPPSPSPRYHAPSVHRPVSGLRDRSRVDLHYEGPGVLTKGDCMAGPFPALRAIGRDSRNMPRFVLLEHCWNGVHWDLMLEHGEVLRTWAIDAPLVANRDLPARSLPDHRRAYLEFEGEVSGNRGTVRRIDEGAYTAKVWEDNQVRIRLEGAQLVGEAELRQVGLGSDGRASWRFRFMNLD